MNRIKSCCRIISLLPWSHPLHRQPLSSQHWSHPADHPTAVTRLSKLHLYLHTTLQTYCCPLWPWQLRLVISSFAMPCCAVLCSVQSQISWRMSDFCMFVSRWFNQHVALTRYLCNTVTHLANCGHSLAHCCNGTSHSLSVQHNSQGRSVTSCLLSAVVGTLSMCCTLSNG